MLIKVKKLDYDSKYTYAPFTVDAVVNTDHITMVCPVDTRRPEKCVIVYLENAPPIHCVGVPSDFLDKESSDVCK